jgi:Domain of unknown function (DUF4157)
VIKMHKPVPGPVRTSTLPVSVPGDRFEQEADHVADAVVRGESSPSAGTSSPVSTLQRASDGRKGEVVDTVHVAPVLRSSGQPLSRATRAQMDDRLGFDFSGVRVHADAEAAHSARAVGARAYTIGSDVVFGAGEYAPRSREGQRLIAHELTHVRQQASAPPMLQRWNIFSEIAGLFAGDSFDPKTLTQYITDLGSGEIEGHSDSDNKARAIVAAWKKNNSAFNLTPKIKALLIKEMQSGYCGDDDEIAILDLLTTAGDDELTQMFTTEKLSAKNLNSDIDFAENDQLMAFFAARFEGGFAQLKQGKVVVKSGGVAKAGPVAVDKTPEKPRLDYVFIMGDTKKDSFYREAAKYFRIHYPQADLMVDERTLDGVLAHVDRNIKDPIGHLYIVSHGNEDGTLSFGLDEGDMIKDPKNPKSLRGDSHLSPMELKEALHPEGGGKSTLRDVSGKIDAKTTIHIRGCDLGQNKEFVNLIDEAFGGKGRVVASTHEQGYFTDPVLAEAARAKAKKAIEDSEPMPPPVSPDIKDKTAKRTAVLARDKAIKERKTRINQKLKDQKQDIDEAAALAGSTEAMSGVVMQRPGSTKFSEEEITTEMERRYGHLTKEQRAGFIARVLKGQRVETQKFTRFRANVPIDSAQARIVFAPQLREKSFVPDPKQDVEIETNKKGDGTESKTYTFHDKKGGFLVTQVDEIPANDKMVVRDAQTDSPNPHNFTWEVKRVRAGAQLEISAVATRVFADLHHQSLDVEPHKPFSPGEDNPIFYEKSTYGDPKEAAKKGAKKDEKKK